MKSMLDVPVSGANVRTYAGAKSHVRSANHEPPRRLVRRSRVYMILSHAVVGRGSMTFGSETVRFRFASPFSYPFDGWPLKGATRPTGARWANGFSTHLGVSPSSSRIQHVSNTRMIP